MAGNLDRMRLVSVRWDVTSERQERRWDDNSDRLTVAGEDRWLSGYRSVKKVTDVSTSLRDWNGFHQLTSNGGRFFTPL